MNMGARETRSQMNSPEWIRDKDKPEGPGDLHGNEGLGAELPLAGYERNKRMDQTASRLADAKSRISEGALGAPCTYTFFIYPPVFFDALFFSRTSCSATL